LQGIVKITDEMRKGKGGGEGREGEGERGYLIVFLFDLIDLRLRCHMPV
jgi:hypothetical protein